MNILKDIKKQFPLLKQYPELIYLDNAATTQKPQVVLDAVQGFYTKKNANIHRGAYQLSTLASEEYEQARKTVADFIHAEDDEIVFTSGATQGLNMLCSMLTKNLGPKDNVVITEAEHHANLIPWQQAAKEKGFSLRYIRLQDDFTFCEEDIEQLIDQDTRVISCVHVSNTLGTIMPLAKVIKKARAVGARTIVDACQSIAHMPINVKELDCDFLVFSGHKVYGPTGIGVLYGKRELLAKINPVYFGGGIVADVSLTDSVWKEAPTKFESGTPPIAQAIGLSAAITWIKDVDMKKIQKHERHLTSAALAMLDKLPGVQIIGPGSADKQGSLVSFLIDGVHPHDAADILDSENIAVRAGMHCTHPLMKKFDLPGTIRISFGLYNSDSDIASLKTGIEKVQDIFGLTYE